MPKGADDPFCSETDAVAIALSAPGVELPGAATVYCEMVLALKFAT